MGKDFKTECSETLKAFDGNISGTDKSDACRILFISRPTLDKYLEGNVPNVDLAVSIIEFFNNRISEKREKIKKAV